MEADDGHSSGRSSRDGDRPHSAGSAGSPGHGTNRSLGPAHLLEVVENMYKSFNPAQVTLDTHVDNCIGELELSNSYDETFVRQVVYGIVRYRSFLGCIMDSFYHYNGGIALREDMDMYKIMAYLTIFRLEELGHANLKRLVDAKEPQKMVVFFRYLFNPTYLKSALRDDWLKLYDKEFVDSIVQQLVGCTPEMTKLLDALDDKVYFTRKREEGHGGSILGVASEASGASRQSPGAAATLPKPFNLSQPRPKPAQAEVALAPAPRLRPAPAPHTGPTREEQALQATKEANRKKLEAKWARARAFQLRCTERPSTLAKIRDEIAADLERQLTFAPPRAKPVPPAPTAQVRLNAAAVLREDALYRKKQADEASMLQRYEAELRDASMFKSWQQEMLTKDEAARQAAVEQRRAAMVAVQESAQQARANQVASNLELGRQLKAEARDIAAAKDLEREHDIRQKQAKRSQVVEARAGVAVAAERLASEKRSAAEEERRRQAADAKALMEAQLRDNAEKRDIIMQLRALENVPRPRVVEFDSTQMPDHGLLDSMPLVELRERLAVAKRKAKEEEERRRAANLEVRQDRENMLLAKVANIQRIRKISAAQAATRRDAARVDASTAAAVVASAHEDSVLILNSKLEAKRSATAAERSRIAADTKKIRFEQMQQAAGAAAVEANKFHELRAGARREAQTRQVTRLQEAGVYEATRTKAQQVRMQVVKQTQRDKTEFLKEYEERLAQATAQCMAERRAEQARAKQHATQCHEAERAAHNAHVATSYAPFSASTVTTALSDRLAALSGG